MCVKLVEVVGTKADPPPTSAGRGHARSTTDLRMHDQGLLQLQQGWVGRLDNTNPLYVPRTLVGGA